MAITMETRPFVTCDHCGKEVSCCGTFESEASLREHVRDIHDFGFRDGTDCCPSCAWKLFRHDELRAAEGKALARINAE